MIGGAVVFVFFKITEKLEDNYTLVKTFWNAIETSISKTFIYTGRASRFEYNCFALWAFIFLTIFQEGLLSIILSVGFAIPQISLATRRLHDIGKSGWFQLISFTIIGVFPLMYWLIFKKGDEGNNIYGQNPLKNDFSHSKNEKSYTDNNKGKHTNEHNSQGSSENNIKNKKTEKYFGELLGLRGKISMSDIHKAYRTKMKEYHPDKISNMAEELQELALKRTKEINEAYEYFKKKYGE